MQSIAALFVILIPRFAFVLANRHDKIFDLSHDIFENMPVWDGGGPPEISLVEKDEGNGLR